MTRHYLAAACLLIASALSAAPAEDLRTDEWGFVWPVPEYKFENVETNATQSTALSWRTVDPALTNAYLHVYTNVVTTVKDGVTLSATTSVWSRSSYAFNPESEFLADLFTTTYTSVVTTTEAVRPYGAYVSRTNTPGNALFSGYRMTAAEPFYFAFVDGFDTRTLGTWTDDTNDFARLTEAVTNAYDTPRFVMLADLADRFQRLERLECGTNAAMRARWSTTLVDAAIPTNLPPCASFDFTHNLKSKVYGNDSVRTRWLPCFAAMDTNAATYRVRSNRIQNGIFTTEVLPAISLGDVGVAEILEEAATNTVVSSLPSFDGVLYANYGASVTSTVPPTARHDLFQIAQQDRALSLFDRTVEVMDNAVAYTNLLSASCACSVRGDTSLGSVTVSMTSDGPIWEECAHGNARIDLSGVFVTNRVDATNSYVEFHSPKCRITKPSLTSFASLSLPDATVSRVVATDDQEFAAFIFDIMDAIDDLPSRDVFVRFRSYMSSAGATLEATAYDVGDETRLLATASHVFAFPLDPLARTYSDVRGSASLTSSYTVRASRTPRLPYDEERPTSATNFLASAKKCVFGSFIWRDDNVPWNASVLPDETCTPNPRMKSVYTDEGWVWVLDDTPTHVVGWGYRAAVDLTTKLREELTAYEAKCAIGNALSPDVYTCLGASDLDTAIENFNTNCMENGSVSLVWAGIGDSGENAEPLWDGWCYVMDDEGAIRVFIDDEEVEEFPLISCSLVIQITLPVSGVSILNEAKSVDTRLKCVADAAWDFPQLTTKPQPQTQQQE